MATYAMYETMHRQPDDVRHLLDTGWPAAEEAAARLSDAPRIFVVGIGTSFHAAQVGEALLRAAGSEAYAVGSFDFVTYPPVLRPGDAVIVMAHRGTKTYSARAVELAQAADVTCIGISGQDSKFADSGADLVLRTTAQERSAAFTASHLGAMTVLAQVATALAERRGLAVAAEWREALAALPAQIEEVLGREAEVQQIADTIVAAGRRVYVIGAGPSAVTATEASLKARETAYITIDGMSLEQFLHGPIVTVNENDQIIVIAADGPAMPRLKEICAALRIIGSPMWVVGREVPSAVFSTHFELPATPEPIAPLLNVVPVQLLAYFFALAKGTNPDTFRRDDQKYLAAFTSLAL
ncbi:MAG: SIS domain-containing protein [Thermomicrobiales bacterium]